MCDFHSIIVRRDGAKAHVMTNSHSGAVEAAKWRENDQMADMRGPFFVECEWGGNGEYPGADKITRSCDFNEKQRKTIDAHYQSLSKLLADPKANAEAMLFDGGVFAGDEYGDIRWKVLVHDDCPKALSSVSQNRHCIRLAAKSHHFIQRSRSWPADSLSNPAITLRLPRWQRCPVT